MLSEFIHHIFFSESSWSVLYKVESFSKVSTILDSRNTADITQGELVAGLDLVSPLNVKYTVLESNTISFVSEAAFNVFLSVPVLQVDIDSVSTEFVSVWETFTHGKNT